MTIARRLPVSGGSIVIISPAPPLPTASALAAAPNGGGSQLTLPRGLYHATPNKTFLAYIDGGSGNLEGLEYDHAADTIGGPYVIHAALERDAHSSCALIRRTSDGKLIAFYSRHAGSGMNFRISNSADSLNGWTTTINIDSQLGGTQYTNPQLYEYDGDLYLLYRNELTAGTDSRWTLSTNSAVSFATGWPTGSVIYGVSGTRSYLVSCFDAVNERIHFIVTNGQNTGFSKLGHFYRDMVAGTYHKSDGTEIFSPPFTFTEVTEIASGAGLFPWNVVVDGSGFPVVAARNGARDYLYIRWDGSTWATTNVVNAGTGYEYNGAGTGFIAYGAAIEDTDPDVMWLIADDAGQPELFRYETADGGATFSDTQVTTGSTQLQLQVTPIVDAHPDLRVFWHRGTFTHYTSFNLGTLGAGV